jgi:hypothetical protein
LASALTDKEQDYFE